MAQIIRKRKCEESKNTARTKTRKFCKTRLRKSGHYIFNVFVCSAGQDMVTDTGKNGNCRCKFKAPHLQEKIQKLKCLP